MSRQLQKMTKRQKGNINCQISRWKKTNGHTDRQKKNVSLILILLSLCTAFKQARALNLLVHSMIKRPSRIVARCFQVEYRVGSMVIMTKHWTDSRQLCSRATIMQCLHSHSFLFLQRWENTIPKHLWSIFFWSKTQNFCLAKALISQDERAADP